MHPAEQPIDPVGARPRRLARLGSGRGTPPPRDGRAAIPDAPGIGFEPGRGVRERLAPR